MATDAQSQGPANALVAALHTAARRTPVAVVFFVPVRPVDLVHATQPPSASRVIVIGTTRVTPRTATRQRTCYVRYLRLHRQSRAHHGRALPAHSQSPWP